ncbi:unnamed protein product, partial [Mycena citricolor]
MHSLLVSSLDEQHEAIQAHLGHDKLCYAPLEELEPRRILELGCGTGLWAAQAAQMFPDAHVVAVDSSAMSSRSLMRLPENASFYQTSILDYLDTQPESFDIVHARFVLMHNPNPEALINRTIGVLKPGGYLLIEDYDFNSLIET